MPDAQTGGPLIYGVPLGLWVAVGAALLSAGAAVLVAWRSNVNARRNIEKQLQRSGEEFDRKLKHESEQVALQLRHDAEQRDRDRQMSLRREVYLEAAAALTNLQSLMGKVTSLEHGNTSLLTEFGEGLAKLAKVHVIGGQATVTALMNYTNEFGPAFIDMLTRRVPLMLRKSMIDTHTALMNKAGVERERFVAMTQHFNLEGIDDPQKWAAVNKQYEFATQQFELHQNKIIEIQALQLKDHTEAGEAANRHVANIANLIPLALLAIRDELEIPLQKAAYMQLWQTQSTNAALSYKAAMDRMDEMMRESAAAGSEKPASPKPPDIQ